MRLAKAGLAVAYGKLKDRYMGPFPTAFHVDYNTRTLKIEVDRNKSSLIIRNLTGFEVKNNSFPLTFFHFFKKDIYKAFYV